MKLISEWTFEGSLKSTLSKIGNRREYGLSGTEPVINQECMNVHARENVTDVKLSGTAIIRIYYRLRQMA